MSTFWAGNKVGVCVWRGVGLAAALTATAIAAGPDIPRLDWQPRSDWLNVKRDVTPSAAGDGRADDTAALQAALERGVKGRTVYLPPGRYRLTQTLAFHGPAEGAAIIGHGRDTCLIWDGAEGGRMFLSDGLAYCRYVGLSWDGRGKAAVGLDHAARRRFETEVTHEHEAFRNFAGYGIRVGGQPTMATAEVLYHNCLFEHCGTALGFLTFNDYDNTIDGCEFRDCGSGVVSRKSNFYARNCHFEHSREADFVVGPEHGCSIRRCTSVGSKCFVWEPGTIAPLTLQDCKVADWTGPEAVRLNGGPVLMFDCSFSGALPKAAPVGAVSASQKLLVSNNEPAPLERLVAGISPNRIYVIPPGQEAGMVLSASQHFLQETSAAPGRAFDAVRDFGAKGDRRTDDTAAIQSAIDAARQHGRGAIAYLPAGRYCVSRSLSITGRDYTFGGSGFGCGLVWRGEPGKPIIVVSGADNLTLANFMVGNHDLGPMNHSDDVLVTSPAGRPCRVVLDEVYAFGMYQKEPDKHGIHFDHLPADSVVDARHVQGNLRITDCSRSRLLFRTSYEGTVTIEGPEPSRVGFFGFQTRVSTRSRPALRVFDNNSVVMSDFYNEQSDQIAVIRGAANESEGRITIQGPKAQMLAQNPVFDVEGYSGQIYYGQTQFYCEPKETEFRLSGMHPVRLILAGDFWYNNRPQFRSDPAARVMLVGNSGALDSRISTGENAALSAALDDLRRLGKLDRELSQASLSMPGSTR